MVILGDAGMGETMLLSTIARSDKTVLLPSGVRDKKRVAYRVSRETLDAIDSLTGKPETMLLLDALGEDSSLSAMPVMHPTLHHLRFRQRGGARGAHEPDSADRVT